VSGYIQTGGSVPNDLPQGKTHTDLGHVKTVVVRTGTDVDGTIESTLPAEQRPTFTFKTPMQEVKEVFGASIHLFETETSYIGVWELLGVSDVWNTFSKNWENA